MSQPEKMCVECYRCAAIDAHDGEWSVVASAFDAREWYEWRCGYCSVARRLRTSLTTRPPVTLRAGRNDQSLSMRPSLRPSLRVARIDMALSMSPGSLG